LGNILLRQHYPQTALPSSSTFQLLASNKILLMQMRVLLVFHLLIFVLRYLSTILRFSILKNAYLRLEELRFDL